MEIKTKYEIGTHVWYVYKDIVGGTVRLYDCHIEEVIIGEKGLMYLLSEGFEEAEEENIIEYEDVHKLYDAIVKNMIQIREEEKNG